MSLLRAGKFLTHIAKGLRSSLTAALPPRWGELLGELLAPLLLPPLLLLRLLLVLPDRLLPLGELLPLRDFLRCFLCWRSAPPLTPEKQKKKLISNCSI